jgi:hypothetical protein
VSSAAPGARSLPLVPRPEDLRSVKILGLGGVGGIVARYLVLYLDAAGHPVRVTLIDGDDFEARNAERMLFSRCGNKAAVVRDDLLLDLAENSRLTLSAVEEYATPENLDRLLVDGDVALLAVDNHATRKLVGDYCHRHLDDVCLISGGNDGVGEDTSGHKQRGTYGNVQIHLRCGGDDETPPIAAYHPEIATPHDSLPTDISCTEALSSVPQILFANLATASAMLNAFFLHTCRHLDYPELCFDIADGLMRPVQLPWR